MVRSDKGFGFVSRNSAARTFVHATALERAGLTGLAEGQAVRMSVIQGVKGAEAGAISVD
jgi:CspA family cold shock protein